MSDFNDFAKALPAYVQFEGPQAFTFFDDFVDLNVSGTGGAAKWRLFETAAGSTQLLDVSTYANGVLQLAFSSPTDEDVISLIVNAGILGNATQQNQPIRFGCRFNMSVATTQNLFIGLSVSDTSIEASFPSSAVGFEVNAADGDGTVDVVTRKGSGTAQTVSNVATLAAATWCRAYFDFWPTTGNTDSGRLDYKLHTNGAFSEGSLTVVDEFPDNVVLYPTIQTQIEGTTSPSTYIDWVYCQALRDDYVEGTG